MASVPFGLLTACFFVSGASALVYELVWFRWLAQMFGSTTLAVSTVLAAFMAGLALGSGIARRLLPRLCRSVWRPVWLYGCLEVLIGLYALVVPGLFALVVPALQALGLSDASSVLGLSLGRFAVAAPLLVLPTAGMGAALPLLAQAVAGRPSIFAGIGGLYAANTAGAALGAAVTGFLLVPAFGVIAANGVAAALNLAAGLTAIWLDRPARAAPSGRPAPAPRASVAPASRPPVASVTPVLVDPGSRVAVEPAWLAAAATVTLCGAMAMVYETVWSRILALVLGSSVYAFTVVLTTVLLGLSAGSGLAARRVDRLREPGLALAVANLLLGAGVLAGVMAVGRLPDVFRRLFAVSGGAHVTLLAMEFVVAGIVVLAPAVCLGAVSAIAVRLAAPARDGAGAAVGALNALNAGGAILGAVLGGFALVPAWGLRGTLLRAVLVNVAWAALLLLVFPGRRRAAAYTLALGLPLAAMVGAALAPVWPPEAMTTGVAIYAPGLSRLSPPEFQGILDRTRILSYEDGLTATVSVETRDGVRSLRVDGKPDASTAPIDMTTQVLLGHLPMLFHRHPQKVLVIGLGSGVSVGSALRHGARAVTVVELEPAVVRASRFFDDVSSRPLEDARTRLVQTDARSFLWLTPERFDVILSEPSNPWMAVAANLFTQEFLRQGRAKLQAGGVFGQWVQLYSLTPELLRSVVATFASVFPQAVAFQTSPVDLVLVGSAAPIAVDYPSLAARLTAPDVREDLERIGIRTVSDLARRLALDVEDVPRFAAGAALNTQDNARLEFAAPRTLYMNTVSDNLRALAAARRGAGAVLSGIARTAPAGTALP